MAYSPGTIDNAIELTKAAIEASGVEGRTIEYPGRAAEFMEEMAKKIQELSKP